MKIDTDRFLTLTAILAGTGLGVACSSSDSNGNNGSGDAGNGGSSSGGKASGGAGASTGGKSAGGTSGGGGTAGAGGSSGKAGAGGSSGGGGRDAGSGGGTAGSGGGGTAGSGGTGPGACLGDTLPPAEAGAPDAAGLDPCAALPAALTDCGDAGVEGVLAPALAVCSDAQLSLRPGVFAALVECLKSGTAPANACNAAAKTHALGCFDTVAGKACSHPPDAGANPCAAFTAACPAITAKTCNDVFNAFSQEGMVGLTTCLQAATPTGDAGTDAGASCGFWQCVMSDITR